MINIANRINMFKTVTVDEIDQKDIYSIDFKSFDFGEVQYSPIKENEYARPDLISARLLGTASYWWFLMWFNGFSDAWNDLMPETIVKYPSINKIREAMKVYGNNA